MKASELRIGNWYFEFGISKQATAEFIKRLDDIQAKGKIAIDVSPIPLSPEILEKAGFVLLENGWMYLDLIFCKISFERLAGLSLSIGEESIYLPHIKHLHQLQNLYFALTGQELAINL